jgi:hypothetical protein
MGLFYGIVNMLVTLKVSILLCVYISESYVILSPTQLIISLLLILADSLHLTGNNFKSVHPAVCVCVCVCIYIYIYIYRERERERGEGYVILSPMQLIISL